MFARSPARQIPTIPHERTARMRDSPSPLTTAYAAAPLHHSRVLLLMALLPAAVGLWRSVAAAQVDPLLAASLLLLMLLRAGRYARPGA